MQSLSIPACLFCVLALFEFLEAQRKYYQRLQIAANWFERARVRDPGYLPAYVNLAAVRDPLGEYDFALVWSRKAIDLAREQEAEVALAHAHIVRAIARLHSDEANDTTDVPGSGTLPPLDIYTRATGNWKALVVEAGYSLYPFVATTAEYDGQTARGIRRGDAGSRVEEAYGSPSHVVAHSDGVDRVYERRAVIFRSAAGDQVRGWILYHGTE